MSTPVKLSVTTGQRIGSLTVVEPETRKAMPSSPKGERAALCACDCGNLVTVALYNLLKKRGTVSCGCEKRRRARQLPRITTHNLTNHPLYDVHRTMIRRCLNPECREYRHYGGRGIKIHPQWLEVAVFIRDVERETGPRPRGCGAGGRSTFSLDRIDNDGNYQPGNIRWATQSEQNANRRTRRAA